MPFPKFSFPGSRAAPAASATDSVEALRRRARQRLIGAIVLVVAAVVGFPLVFDSQPRPVKVDLPIIIPDRNQAPPLKGTTTPASTAGETPGRAPGASESHKPLSPQASLGAGEAVVEDTPSPPAVAASKTAASAPTVAIPIPAAPTTPATPSAAMAAPAKPSVAAASKANTTTNATSTKPAPAGTPTRPEPAHAAGNDDAARARALLEGRSSAATPAASRYVVQIGAFSDAAKARETRLKVERAGLVTYTQVVETPDGKRIRVRVGPYGDRPAADHAAERIRALGLPAVVLAL